MHTMFKYVVLWYAEEISLSLRRVFLFLKSANVPFSVCLEAFVTSVINNLKFSTSFCMDNCNDKYHISIDKM